jgi:hypothetical protein
VHFTSQLENTPKITLRLFEKSNHGIPWLLFLLNFIPVELQTSQLKNEQNQSSKSHR